jgi:predicted nicotinamide N-methyase
VSDAQLAALESSLRRRFRVVESTIDAGDRPVTIMHPASAEDLIDERDFERDERLPYWAELWPSARVLARHILELSGVGKTFIELGCGAGLVATCASLAGFDVVVSDYYEDATRFARVNAWRNGAPVSGSVVLDWRALPPPHTLQRFDVVAASDVLYERAYGELVAEAISSLLAPHGLALVADPGRVARDEFLRALAPRGLEVRRSEPLAYRDNEIRQTITVFEIGRAQT